MHLCSTELTRPQRLANVHCRFPACNHTTGLVLFAECPKHSAKPILHSTKDLPSMALCKLYTAIAVTAKKALPSAFSRTLGKTFAMSQKALGKNKVREPAKLPVMGTLLCARRKDTRLSSVLCGVSFSWHTTKMGTLSCACFLAHGKVHYFAECLCFCASQSLYLYQVLLPWHLALGTWQRPFLRTWEWLLCRVPR